MDKYISDVKAFVSERLDIPEDMFTSGSVIKLIGNEKLSIENHKGIIKYSQEEIQVKCEKFTLLIKGKGLNILGLISEEIIIGGEVFGVEFL